MPAECPCCNRTVERLYTCPDCETDYCSNCQPPSTHGCDALPDDPEGGCPKCSHTNAEVDRIATAGDGASKLFDIQNRSFKTVSCTNCGYTEFYRSDTGTSNALDVFLG